MLTLALRNESDRVFERATLQGTRAATADHDPAMERSPYGTPRSRRPRSAS
jgi:hypothetical protein